MRNLDSKRFGAHEVVKGKFSGGVHVAPGSFYQFTGELNYLSNYLNNRLLPFDPEERSMQLILINCANLIDYEAENSIKYFVEKDPISSNVKYWKSIEDGFVTLKSKTDWMLKRKIILKSDRDIIEEIRVLRNSHVHTFPTEKRQKYLYRGKP